MADAAPAPAVIVPAPAAMSFVDAETADPASAIIDEVLGGEAAAPPEGAATEGEQTTEEGAPAPAAVEPAKAEPAPNDVDSARLRKGFAKLAEERQRIVDRESAARAQVQAASGWREKAERHDALMERLQADPAAVIWELGGDAVNKALQGFIDREKSPAERRVDELERQTKRDRDAAVQRETEAVAARWRNDVITKVQGDERFDLVNTLNLHGDVIDVITTYYDKHSERDDKGNITVPAILPWEIAAQAVEENRAAMIEKSKRYGKRAPVADTKKDAPTAKNQPAPAKRATTSLSSVPVSEAPSREEDLPTDDLDERERRVLASLGI